MTMNRSMENKKNESNETKPVIWIISHYAGGPSYCPRIPDYLLAKYLQEHGYRAFVIASSYVHNTELNFAEGRETAVERTVDGVPFIFIRTRNYSHTFDRMMNMLEFYFNLKKCYRKFPVPDLVMAAMPTPTNCLAGEQIAGKYKVPYITSIVDLWPLSIVEYADFSNRNPIIQALYIFEKWIYRKSDALVFSWEGAYDYIRDKGWDKAVPHSKFHYINIGVDLETFAGNLEKYRVEDKDLEDDVFKVMYCGSVRTANDIDTVVSCAKKLNEEGYADKIRFIIYGDGPDREILADLCRREHIDNVIFKGYIDKKYIPYVLSRSNLNILNLKSAATQKYGNSSNKLFEYFAAGNPVVANIDEGKYPIISRYHCGKIVKATSIEQYANAIRDFYEMDPEEYAKYRRNALKTAELFDTKRLNAEWEKIIRKLLIEKRGD